MRSVLKMLAPGRRPMVAAVVAIVALALAAAASAAAAGAIGFYGKPGTGKPPAKLHGRRMKTFSADTRAVGTSVTTVAGPTGKLTFTASALVEQVGNGWNTWSNGYTGNVYFFQTKAVTIKLPPKTTALYLYVEPNKYVEHHVVVKAGSTSSGATTVLGDAGAKYFGFYVKTKGSIKTITVKCDDGTGFGIGELAISKAKLKSKK
jgi:hypothetical protein